MNSVCSRFCFLLFLFLSLNSPASAEKRVGLVIGINDYPEDSNFPDLQNCINDAKLIAKTLESVGFEVIEVTDADLSTIDDALSQFEDRIEEGDTALIYFAGHGIEYNGQNYLMASNAVFKSRSRLTREAMEADVFAATMVHAGAKSSFLLLDCCRELPSSAEWAGRGQKKFGLAELNVDGDIMISMAAAPGKQALEPNKEGGNSPYAMALAKWIPQGTDHLNLFQNVRREVYEMTDGMQRPWENGSFLDPFHFAEAKPAKPVASENENELAKMQAEIDRLKKEAAARSQSRTSPPIQVGRTPLSQFTSEVGSAPVFQDSQAGMKWPEKEADDKGFETPASTPATPVFPAWSEREMTDRETPVTIIPGLNLGR